MTNTQLKPKRHPRSLFIEYLRHWYVIILTVLMCFPAYAVEALAYSFLLVKKIPAFGAALISIGMGGFIATFPLLILNIILIVRRKYYAIAVQIALLELIGTAFFLVNQIGLAHA